MSEGVDSAYHGEITLLLHSGGGECMPGTEDFFGLLLLILCPVIKVSGKLQLDANNTLLSLPL